DFTGGVFPSGTVSFTGSQTSQLITVSVNGDTTLESNDGFSVTLSNPSAGWSVSGGPASGLIINDDAPTSPAGDVAIIGYDTAGSTNDSLTIMLMRDYLAGEKFFVNDNEVSTPGGTSFTDLNEAEAQFTANANLARGTIINLPWGAGAVSN